MNKTFYLFTSLCIKLSSKNKKGQCGAVRRSPPITRDLRPTFREFCRHPTPTVTLSLD